MKFILITLLCILINSYYALPYGASETVCSSLIPVNQGRTPGKDIPMYQVSAVKSGNKVTVKIFSADNVEFQGFILQARSTGNPSIFIDGEFTTSEESKTIDCFGGIKNTLTNVNTISKKEIITEWTPKKPGNEYITFRATVEKDNNFYWTEIDTTPIKLSNGSEEDLDIHPAYNGCFNRKGCYGYPDNCIQARNCDILLTWSISADDTIVYGLHGCVDSKKTMALSLSEDNKAGDDSTIKCIKDGDDIVVLETLQYDNINRSREFPEDSYGVSIKDGLTTCKWKRPYVYETYGESYNLLKTKYFILITRSVYYGSPHFRSQDMVVAGPFNFTALLDYEDACDPFSAKIIGNGSAKYPYVEPDEYDPKSMCRREIASPKGSPNGITSPKESPNGVSHLRSSLLSMAILWLFYAARGVLY